MAIKLDDKEFVVENGKTIVIAHKTPQSVSGHGPEPGYSSATLMLRGIC
jgi:hypothetical protein